MNKLNNEPHQGAPGYPNSAPQGLAELFGVTAAMQMLRRRLLIMGLVGLSVAAAAFTFLMLQTPSYTATSLLIINPRTERVLNSEAVVGSLPLQSSAIDSERACRCARLAEPTPRRSRFDGRYRRQPFGRHQRQPPRHDLRH